MKSSPPFCISRLASLACSIHSFAFFSGNFEAIVFVTFVSLFGHHLAPVAVSELLTSSMIGSSLPVSLLGAELFGFSSSLAYSSSSSSSLSSSICTFTNSLAILSSSFFFLAVSSSLISFVAPLPFFLFFSLSISFYILLFKSVLAAIRSLFTSLFSGSLSKMVWKSLIASSCSFRAA